MRRASRWLGFVLVVGMLPIASGSVAARRKQPTEKPRLLVVISIDQFRADYLRRFEHLFLPAQGPKRRPGGFRWLMSNGAYYPDARYGHVPLQTGPGHAVILTGAPPSLTGIVGNEWARRGPEGRLVEVYCVDDASVRTVGGQGKPMGPANLRVSTLGDELRLARAGSKVVGIALKDRAAILLVGHAAGAQAVWFDNTIGRWISSSAYFPGGSLPGWVNTSAQQAIVEATFGEGGKWELLDAGAASALTKAVDLKDDRVPPGVSPRFPHTFQKKDGGTVFRAFEFAPQANALVFETALEAIRAERLGQDDDPDVLAINLSTNDYLGHAFGPYSPEVLDITLRTDVELSRFFQALQDLVPGGLSRVVVAVTGDHGVAPVQEQLSAAGIPGARLEEKEFLERVEAALDVRFGPEDWAESGGIYAHPNLWIAPAAMERAAARGHARESVEAEAASALQRVHGVYAAFTRTQLMTGRAPDSRLGRAVTAGFHPAVSGDVVVVLEPYHVMNYPGPYSSDHGTPYVYDTNVPIMLAGPGIAPGRKHEPASIEDLAPTLALLLGIGPPNAAEGRLLRSALE